MNCPQKSGFAPLPHQGLTHHFLPTRHSNRETSGVLWLAGLPEPLAVQPVAGTMLGGMQVAWREFLRRRSGEPAKTGYGFLIEFPEEVQGPVAVGAESHFGVGGFAAGESKTR